MKFSKFDTRQKILTSGEAETCPAGRDDENEEEDLLRKVGALSEENENDEEELLRQAIALSLED